MTVPDTFMNQQQYDNWLTELAVDELNEFLDVYDEDALHVDQIHAWTRETPALEDDDWNWVKLYLPVRQFCHAPLPGERISLPEENPFPAIARATRHAVAEDLACLMHETLEEDGYEVKA